MRVAPQVATNALLEREGERTALAVTQGFADLLLIGNQTRPKIFDLDIHRPDLLYEEVVEVPEDVIMPIGDAESTRNGRPPPPAYVPSHTAPASPLRTDIGQSHSITVPAANTSLVDVSMVASNNKTTLGAVTRLHTGPKQTHACTRWMHTSSLQR